MKPARVEAYKRLKQKIESVKLKDDFKDKKEILLKMAAICTGMSEEAIISSNEVQKIKK